MQPVHMTQLSDLMQGSNAVSFQLIACSWMSCTMRTQTSIETMKPKKEVASMCLHQHRNEALLLRRSAIALVCNNSPEYYAHHIDSRSHAQHNYRAPQFVVKNMMFCNKGITDFNTTKIGHTPRALMYSSGES